MQFCLDDIRLHLLHHGSYRCSIILKLVRVAPHSQNILLAVPLFTLHYQSTVLEPLRVGLHYQGIPQEPLRVDPEYVDTPDTEGSRHVSPVIRKDASMEEGEFMWLRLCLLFSICVCTSSLDRGTLVYITRGAVAHLIEGQKVVELGKDAVVISRRDLDGPVHHVLDLGFWVQVTENDLAHPVVGDVV